MHGALTGLFFFWGWGVTLNLPEETRDVADAPGRSAVSAMVIVALLFVFFVISCQLVLTDEEMQQSSTNVVFALAQNLSNPFREIASIIGGKHKDYSSGAPASGLTDSAKHPPTQH